MKKISVGLGFALVLSMLSACVAPQGQEKLQADRTRYEQQQKRYPDKEDRAQQEAAEELARKSDMIKK